MIVAGFGFRAAASVESLADALDQAAGARTVAALATSDDKACAAAFLRLARKVGAPIRAMDAAVLERQVTVTHSAASHTARGTGSLAEAAALAAAGPGSTLITRRVVSGDGMATCALAEGPGS